MNNVYQIMELEMISNTEYSVILSHIVAKKRINGKIYINITGEFKQMVFVEDGKDSGHFVKGKYSGYSSLCFFHSGETVYVYTDDSHNHYIDVLGCLESPVDTPPKQYDLLVI